MENYNGDHVLISMRIRDGYHPPDGYQGLCFVIGEDMGFMSCTYTKKGHDDRGVWHNAVTGEEINPKWWYQFTSNEKRT